MNTIYLYNKYHTRMDEKMTELIKQGIFLKGGVEVISQETAAQMGLDKVSAARGSMAYSILKAHTTSAAMDDLTIKFDAMASHDITYVGITQTARASGLEKFPIPYVLTNCHNSLCAVGGTINEDDHVFGLSAAKKYGGIFVPAHMAVIHSYMREQMSGCGKMILGSDSHTRYGALGTMAIGEGGPELVKQLLGRTYDIKMPEIICVYLEGKPKRGVGPQDVALALIKAVFENGFVKNKVLEFVGPGVAELPIEYRNGVDVMTTETTCLSSIWITDDITKGYFETHKRPEAYKKLAPADVAYYDGMIRIDLSKVECMIALPFHPSNVYTVKELSQNAGDILREVEKIAVAQLDAPNIKFSLTDKLVGGKLRVDQAVIAGCAGGTYDNIAEAADILSGRCVGTDEFGLSVYPASAPVNLELTRNGAYTSLIQAGAIIRTAFCGPCFGAGDVPANNGLSIRHTTRNFPNREGSKPANGQIASVALMDARSIAATAANEGYLTAASEIEYGCEFAGKAYSFDDTAYKSRVYQGFGKADDSLSLKFGPNIADWPVMSALTENIILQVASVITDPVTTTDELIPSGETSSYRSNPFKLAEFTLSRKDPAYVGRAKAISEIESARITDPSSADAKIAEILNGNFADDGITGTNTGLGSLVFANKPGDGSAREQAASCQKVLGGWANIAHEYATKRYRSNLINWGMLPFLIDDFGAEGVPFGNGDYIFIKGIREAVEKKLDAIEAYIIGGGTVKKIQLSLGSLSDTEREIILSGCLINYYRNEK